MKTKIGFIILSIWCFSRCGTPQIDQFDVDNFLLTDNSICSPPNSVNVAAYFLGNGKTERLIHPRLVFKEDNTGRAEVLPNNNTVAAGTYKKKRLQLSLETVWGDFYPETTDRPGLRLVAIKETGKAPSIPAPLVRVKEGTVIDIKFTNSLSDSTITVFGLQSRPSEIIDSVFLRPGATQKWSFNAGEPGTYLYYVKLGAGNPRNEGEEEQLVGAFIVDPIDYVIDDRIMVINIFSTMITPGNPNEGFFPSLTINGKSWPFTEQYTFDVGDSVKWKVINGSNRNHPMHLHGFYFDVTSRGNMLSDDIYSNQEKRKVVTEGMTGKTTMEMQWVALRPGRWLFHCHLSFHVSPFLRLPGASDMDEPGTFTHMAGLATGININPGPSELIEKEKPQLITLYLGEFKNSRHEYGFKTKPIATNDQSIVAAPGPALILNQYKPAMVTVKNQLKVPTSIHWHGLEIDSWSDGVPGWSSSDGKTSPMILPGEEFTYKLSTMRPGTFVYHSHLDDIQQITRGVFGAIIVLPPNETFNHYLDHPYVISWNTDAPMQKENVEMNGRFYQPDIHIKVGEKHRLRFINIEPAGQIAVHMEKDNQVVPLKYLAKDGADLSEYQQIMLDKSPRYGAGETADFEFTPTSKGTYTLKVFSNVIQGYIEQSWIVK